MIGPSHTINRPQRDEQQLLVLMDRLFDRYGGPAGVPDGIWGLFLERCQDWVEEGARQDESQSQWFSIQDTWGANTEAD